MENWKNYLTEEEKNELRSKRLDEEIKLRFSPRYMGAAAGAVDWELLGLARPNYARDKKSYLTELKERVLKREEEKAKKIEEDGRQNENKWKFAEYTMEEIVEWISENN